MSKSKIELSNNELTLLQKVIHGITSGTMIVYLFNIVELADNVKIISYHVITM